MSKIIILQHTGESRAGSTLKWIVQQGIEFEVFHFLKNERTTSRYQWHHTDHTDVVKTPDTFENFKRDWTQQKPLGLVICGGGMNVDEEHLYPWMKEEKKWIKDLIEQDLPVVGLCLGSQLIAENLGYRVAPVGHWEVGFHEIHWNPDFAENCEQNHKTKKTASTNSVFLSQQFQALFVKPLKAFQYHRYGYHKKDVDHLKPALNEATNAEYQPLIFNGESESWKQQLYFYKDHVVGFQFHPESTWDWIQMCATEDEYPCGAFVQAKEEVLNSEQAQADLQRWYFKFLDLWFKPQLKSRV